MLIESCRGALAHWCDAWRDAWRLVTAEVKGRPPDGTVGFLHVDMDAFYAAVEMMGEDSELTLEVRRRPELRGTGASALSR